MPLDASVVDGDARQDDGEPYRGVFGVGDGGDDDQAADGEKEEVRDGEVDLDGAWSVWFDATQPQHADYGGADGQPERLREVVDEVEYVARGQHQEGEETL